jgi:hypothetical protein
VLCAFDLIELDGRDLHKAPIGQRKDLLAKIMRPVRRSHPGITLNEHYEGDGALIYEHDSEFPELREPVSIRRSPSGRNWPRAKSGLNVMGQ